MRILRGDAPSLGGAEAFELSLGGKCCKRLAALMLRCLARKSFEPVALVADRNRVDIFVPGVFIRSFSASER